MRFRDHVVVGDILELAARYREEGADELVFYDITASPDGRSVDRSWVRRVARILDIPFCVAGGIRSVTEAEQVLGEGAEKVSINSPALTDPELISRLSARFGAQCVVVGIDSQTADGEYLVYQFTGDPDRTRNTARRTLDWVREVQDRGAGEIVLNCMASDGVRRGYDIAQLAAVRQVCQCPVDRVRRCRHDGSLHRSIRRCAGRWCVGSERLPFGQHCDPGSEAIPAPAVGRNPRMSTVVTFNAEQIDALDWSKGDGLLPAIVQHADTGDVLMLGFMNAQSLRVTLESKRVTFFSRSKQRLWTKGETSGNFLHVVNVAQDCDRDSLLITAHPDGPTCHNGIEQLLRRCPAGSGNVCLSRAARIGHRTTHQLIAPKAATRRNCGPKAQVAWRRKSARKVSKWRSPRSRNPHRRCSAKRPTWCFTSRCC